MSDLLRKAARFRVQFGFVVAVLALVLARPTCRTLATGLPVAVIGEAIRLWAAGHLLKGREVTDTGPYRFMRHPLYVGSALLGTGFAIASGSVVVALLVAGYLGTTLFAAVRVEEASLRETFGGDYDAYAAGGRPGGARRFSMDLAISNREHRTVIGVVGVALLLVLETRCLGGL